MISGALIASDRVDVPADGEDRSNEIGDGADDDEPAKEHGNNLERAAQSNLLERFMQDRDKAPVADASGQAARDPHHPNGGDDRRDAALFDQQAIPQAD